MQTTKLPQLRFLKSLEKFIILEVCKRTLCPKFGRLAPAAVILFFLSPGSGLAVDNSNDKTVEQVCTASYILCENTCRLAALSTAQRDACGSECGAGYVRCTRNPNVATQGTTQEGVGEMSTGVVLKDETIKKKRKTDIKQ